MSTTFRIEDSVPAESLIRFAIYRMRETFRSGPKLVRHATDPRRTISPLFLLPFVSRRVSSLNVS